MAGLSRSNLERLKQRVEQGGQLAAETVRGYSGQEPVPAADASPDDWAAYCNAARGRAAAAVIEWGRRIGAAHAAYRAQGQSWGRTWEAWCREHLGIGKGFADQLRLIGENLPVTDCQILPGSTHQLTTLARLKRDHPAAFVAARESGAIGPQLTREQAQALLRDAQVQPALPAAEAPAPPPFRRVAGVTLEAALADKLEAIATARGTTPAQLLAEAAEVWIRRQPMPEGTVTVDTTARTD